MTGSTLRGARILVTGGAGTIGSAIVDQLASEEVGEIVVLDNFVRGRYANLESAMARFPVRVVEGDVRDRDLLSRLTAGIDIIFHQAAIRITQCYEDPRLAFEVLGGGTFNVAEAAVNAGVKKVVAASSASVYGLAEIFPTAEDHHAWDNKTLYGATKVYNEGIFRSFHDRDGLDYVMLRYFNVYGPRMDIHGVYTEVLVRWMERIQAGQPPLILGDGKQTMDFVYVDDIARANILAATSDVTDEAFNVASGTETSLNDLAAAMLRVMGSSLQPEYGPARAVNAVPRRLADTHKAEELLGFVAAVDLDEGLRRLVDWWSTERALAELSA
jgi:UDP-glucose 4-epimerase